ncbi:MarR family winged helix-turn-helix transcriptional regulator [Martelella soudanensis]|uniref:MarR family winged helix-turn-helix transcriptional regulator n=1 Tax=unclassified Martelella TaxID=2629616 RepID=UPI0015DEC8FF|nr:MULTISPECIES: MarR family winged helix-turn-helix transcriptional regulator [unclassified Martelella]
MTWTQPSADDLSSCLLLNTVKTARVLTRRYDNRLRPLGLTVAQFSVLSVMRGNPGKSINALAERVAMDRSTLTRNIDLLVAKGFVVKTMAERGNIKTCALTEVGTARLDAAIPIWLEARSEMQAQLKDHDPVTYLDALSRLAGD